MHCNSTKTETKQSLRQPNSLSINSNQIHRFNESTNKQEWWSSSFLLCRNISCFLSWFHLSWDFSCFLFYLLFLLNHYLLILQYLFPLSFCINLFLRSRFFGMYTFQVRTTNIQPKRFFIVCTLPVHMLYHV